MAKAKKRNYKIQEKLSTGKWVSMSSHTSKKHAQKALKKDSWYYRGISPLASRTTRQQKEIRIKKIISKRRK